MKRKWGSLLAKDPFYNPNLTHDREDFSQNLTSAPDIWPMGESPHDDGFNGATIPLPSCT